MPGLYTGATGLWGGLAGLLGGTGLSTPPGLLADTGFSPAALFASGEQGVWYDPSDFSTMFQNSSGTTPVTGLEQPVGLIQDKSGNGNHASQSTSASRPVLSARYNLLTYSEQFDNAAWAKAQATVTANATTDPLGGSTADLLLESSTAAQVHNAAQGSAVVGVRYTASVYAKNYLPGGTSQRYLQIGGFGLAAAGEAPTFDILNGTVDLGATSTYCKSASVTPVGDGWYLCTAEIVSNSTAGLFLSLSDSATNNGAPLYTGDGTSGIYIWGADLRVSNDGVNLPAYQRVGAATAGSSTTAGTADYDTTGFPPYLRFDGTDDSLATASIDFSATDKMSVFAGVRKLSDAAQGVVAELTATIASNNGAFLLAAPDGATATFGWDSKGTSQVDAVASSQTAPLTAVLTGTADISADSCVLRVNGVQADTDTGDQGSGNYANAVLNIGARSVTSSPSLRFNGRLTSLIVRGAQSTDAQIAQTEAWVDGKTKAVIASSQVTWDATADTYTQGLYNGLGV